MNGPFILAYCRIVSVKKNLPYLLCDAPEGVDLDQLKIEIEKEVEKRIRYLKFSFLTFKFPIRCEHLHIYRRWPDTKSFDVFGHIQLGKIDHFDGNELHSMLADLHKMLKARGAHQINIQPALNNAEQKQKLCVSVDCQQTEKSCCNAHNSQNCSKKSSIA